MSSFERGTIVIMTHNRRPRLLQTLRGLCQLPDRWPIIVIDNGSTDGTAEAVAEEFPSLLLIRSRRNIGSAARNIAVAFAHTPYVAFCDEDTEWLPGSLERAADIMDAHPSVGVINGCVIDADTGRIDPSCLEMAGSPLNQDTLPGPQLLRFSSDSSVVRTRAFYEAGGFWPPLFTHGEEALLSLDLAEKGWRVVYMDSVLLRRFHVCGRKVANGQLRAVRNAIWVAWMRLPAELAWRETINQLRSAANRRQLRPALMWTLGGFTRVLRERHVIAPQVAAMWTQLMEHAASQAAHGSRKPSQESMA